MTSSIVLSTGFLRYPSTTSDMIDVVGITNRCSPRVLSNPKFSLTHVMSFAFRCSVQHNELSPPLLKVGGNPNRRVTKTDRGASMRINVGILWNHGPSHFLLCNFVGVHGDFECIVQNRPSGERGAGEVTVFTGVP